MKRIVCFLLILSIALIAVSCISGRGTPSADESDVSTGVNSEELNVSEELNISEDSTEEAKSKVTPLLWKVTSKDGKTVLWLFGSCDMVDEKALVLPDVVMKSYESSKNLLVINNFIDDVLDLDKRYEMIRYSDDSVIKKHIPEELYKKANQIITDTYGRAEAVRMESFIPAYWATYIRMIYLSKCSLTESVDRNFIHKAKQDGKNILSVESTEANNKRYLDLPEDVQVFLLEQMVATSQEECLKNKMNFYEAWAAGASGYIENTIYNTEGYTKDELPLITQYNKTVYQDFK